MHQKNDFILQGGDWDTLNITQGLLLSQELPLMVPSGPYDMPGINSR